MGSQACQYCNKFCVSKLVGFLGGFLGGCTIPRFLIILVNPCVCLITVRCLRQKLIHVNDAMAQYSSFTLSILWYIINLEQINVINFTLTLRRKTQTIIRKRPKIIHVWNRETENVGSCYIIIEREKKKAFQKTNYGSSFIEKDSKNLENQAPNTCWNAESIARSNWTINVLLQMGSLRERSRDF